MLILEIAAGVFIGLTLFFNPWLIPWILIGAGLCYIAPFVFWLVIGRMRASQPRCPIVAGWRNQCYAGGKVGARVCA